MARFYLALLFLPAVSPAQQSFLGHRVWFTPEQMPDRSFDEVAYRQQIKAKYGEKLKKEKDLNDFTDELIRAKRYYLNSNDEYENWDSVNAYLHKVIAQVPLDIPPGMKITIKVIRDPEVNACAFEDGIIYVNVGLLACFDSEAELAFVLGHEIGHYVKGHSLENYKAYKGYYRSIYTSRSSNSGLLGSLITHAVYSDILVSNEAESDVFSNTGLTASGYNNMAGLTVFQRFRELEEKYFGQKSAGSKPLIYLHTHPRSEKRESRVRKLTPNGGKDFLVDSAYFMRLRRQCIDECINLTFEDLSFNDCNELAFVEHLKFPDDPFYLFYLTECTRRLIAENHELGRQQFITGNYKSSYCKPSATSRTCAYNNNQVVPYRAEFRTALLNHLCEPLLGTDSLDFSSYRNTYLLNRDTVRFVTNKDALEYFVSQNDRISSSFNNLFLGSKPNVTGNRREDFYVGLPETIRNLTSTAPKGRLLWVLTDVTHLHYQQGGFSAEVDFERGTRDSIYRYFRDRSDYMVMRNDLSFSERNSLWGPYGLAYKYFSSIGRKKVAFQTKNSDLMVRDSVDLNTFQVMPELGAILKKYGLIGVVFSSVEITENTYRSMFGEQEVEQWFVRNIYIDSEGKQLRYLNDQLINAKTLFGSTQYDLFADFYRSVLMSTGDTHQARSAK